jgi:hypothetical protein
MGYPSQSWTNKNIQKTSLYRTVLLVGQSNVAVAGIYKDLQNKTEEQINTIFGANSHLSFLIKDALKMFYGFTKPRLMAVSYRDDAEDVKRVLNLEVLGTATESRFLELKINSLNADRIATQTVSAFASIFTEEASCTNFLNNSTVQTGAFKNIAIGYHPVLANIYDNDVIVEVEITSGMTQNQIAAAINTAINAKLNSVYTASVTDNDVILTASHKGLIGQNFTFEIIKSTIPAGISTVITQTTAGSGSVDITNILNLTDENGDKLEILDFDYVVVPYGFSVSNLVIDAKAKFDDVLLYNNKALDYHIFQATSIDLSTDTELDALAVANPISVNNLTRSILVIEKKDNFSNKPLIDYSKIKKIELKQFISIDKKTDNSVFLGNCYSLSSDSIYKELNKLFSVSAIRELYVEHFIPVDFTGEQNYDEFGVSIGLNYNKEDIIAIFKKYRDIIDGTDTTDSKYLDRFSGLIKNNSQARIDYDEILTNSIRFDSSQTLSMNLLFNLVETIKNLAITSFNK